MTEKKQGGKRDGAGRKRVHASASAKQQAYLERRKQREALPPAEPEDEEARFKAVLDQELERQFAPAILEGQVFGLPPKRRVLPSGTPCPLE